LPGRDDHEAVRFPYIGSDLGDELIGGDTDEGSESCLGEDLRLDPPSNGLCRAEETETPSHIQEDFIQAQWLYEVGVAAKDAEDVS
jgi:hypothetical protein